MKKLFKYCTVSAFVMFTAYSLYAQPSRSYRLDRFRNAVYYENRLVCDADVASFVDLGFGYGKDRNHVYRFGNVLEYVDPSSFRVDRRFAYGEKPDLENRYPEGPFHNKERYSGYHKSNFDVYYNGKKMDAHVSSFTILDDGYAKDAFNVFWQGRTIDDAVSSSFKCLGWGYAKDAFNVYWHGKKMEGAVSSSFKVGRNGYADDDFKTYYKGCELE